MQDVLTPALNCSILALSAVSSPSAGSPAQAVEGCVDEGKLVATSNAK